MSYEVEPIDFVGGSASVSNALPRQVNYYSVDSGKPEELKVKLELSQGEAELRIRKDRVPSSSGVGDGNNSPTSKYYTRLNKAGDEFFILGPEYNQDYFEAGTYYLQVTSEGENPDSGRIGTGSSSYTLTSVGPVAPTDLGVLATSGELRRGEAQAAGEARIYQFSVSEGSP